MSKKISDVEGIGDVYAKKLTDIGIKTVEGLLEKGASRAGRKKIAEESGIDQKKILDWVNMADLFRINGVATQFAELLKAAGVDTIKELRTRNAENLHAKLVETNESKKLVRVVPNATKVADFVEQAKEMEPMVTH